MSEASSPEPSPEDRIADAEAQYRLLQPKYLKLATETKYIVEDALLEEPLAIVSVNMRVKSFTSFTDKLRRKNYAHPLEDVTDLAGVRIVSYFRGDLARLEHMIRRHFEVLEKVDKIAERTPDKFGYSAVHFVVCLKNNCSGARYDELQGLKCEIQTRAVLST